MVIEWKGREHSEEDEEAMGNRRCMKAPQILWALEILYGTKSQSSTGAVAILHQCLGH